MKDDNLQWTAERIVTVLYYFIIGLAVLWIGGYGWSYYTYLFLTLFFSAFFWIAATFIFIGYGNYIRKRNKKNNGKGD